MTTTKEHTMTPMFETLEDFRNYLATLQDDRDQIAAGGPSFRADLPDGAVVAPLDDGAEQGGCAHRVLTSTDASALTCGNVRAPDSQTEGAEGREDQRATCAPRYSTDPDQSLRDLKRRTRRDLAAEVRRLRRECAKTRRKLRDAEDRLAELEEAPRV